MTCIAVRCPHGDSKQSVTRRKMPRGIQRSLCQSMAWARGSLLLDSCNQGGVPEVKPHSLAMRLHASGGAIPRGCCASVRRRPCVPSQRKQPCWSRSTLPCGAHAHPTRALWTSSVLAPQRWATWGALWARKVSNAGGGMPSITIRGRLGGGLWALTRRGLSAAQRGAGALRPHRGCTVKCVTGYLQ